VTVGLGGTTDRVVIMTRTRDAAPRTPKAGLGFQRILPSQRRSSGIILGSDEPIGAVLQGFGIKLLEFARDPDSTAAQDGLYDPGDATDGFCWV